MAKPPLYSDDIPIEQKPAIVIKGLGNKKDDAQRPSDPSDVLIDPENREVRDLEGALLSHAVLDPDSVSRPGIPGWRPTPEYLADLAFMNEPVLIRLEPSAEKNASPAFYAAVNGDPAEIRVNRAYQFVTDLDQFDSDGARWYPVTQGYLPVGREMIVKRSILEVIIRAKIDMIETEVIHEIDRDPENRVKRFTTPVAAFSILDDRNPRGIEWVRTCRRRNY